MLLISFLGADEEGRPCCTGQRYRTPCAYKGLGPKLALTHFSQLCEQLFSSVSTYSDSLRRAAGALADDRLDSAFARYSCIFNTRQTVIDMVYVEAEVEITFRREHCSRKRGGEVNRAQLGDAHNHLSERASSPSIFGEGKRRALHLCSCDSEHTNEPAGFYGG